jgi:hypothetical protein
METNMAKGTQAALGVLGVAVVALAIGLIVSLAWDHDPGRMNAGSNDYMGMMDAMGRMDSDDMLERMQSILGTEGYDAMLAHMAEHRSGTAMAPGAGMDGMMHTMMEGMMDQMPADSDGRMPMMR